MAHSEISEYAKRRKLTGESEIRGTRSSTKIGSFEDISPEEREYWWWRFSREHPSN
jgi:hypothetical protein